MSESPKNTAIFNNKFIGCFYKKLFEIDYIKLSQFL